MKKLKVGVIGAGFIGWLHARVFSESFGSELVAVADSNPSLKEKVEQTFGCRFYQKYEDLLENPEIDAVSICLPDDNHVEPSLFSARCKKHILLEKPMARTVSDCFRIKEACDKEGVRIMVAHILRFDPGYRRMYDLVSSGELGEVLHISAERKNSRTLAARLKGQTSMLFYVGIHDIDAIQWISQKQISRVFAQRISRINSQWNSDDCIYILANLEKDAIASIEFSWTFPEDFPAGLKSKLELYGSKTTAFLNRFNMGVEVYRGKSGTPSFELPDIIHWPEANNRILGDLKYEIEHFIDAILNDKEFLMPLPDAISAVNVIETIMRSYTTNEPETIPPLKFS